MTIPLLDRTAGDSDPLRRLTLTVLSALSVEPRQTDAARRILRAIQEFLEIEAVGLRLRDGDDYPYYECRGFSDEFVQAERSICLRDAFDRPVCDVTGNPVLECMCGNVLQGRVDPHLPFFTEGGSFWTNSTTDLLASTSEADRQTRTRNRCNGEGYESVGLIPIRSSGEVIGLLQVNDQRRDRLSAERIAFLENLAGTIGVALARRAEAEESATILSNCADAILTLDRRGLIRRSNPAAWDLTGIGESELLGRPILDLLADPAPGPLPPWLPEPVPGARRVFESSLSRRSGPPLEVEGSAEYVSSGGGRYHVFLRDVTARHRAEEALQESEARLSRIFDRAPLGIVTAGLDYRIQVANPAFCEMLGYAPDELVGLDLRVITHPDDVATEEAIVDDVVRGARRSHDAIKRYIRRDGSIVWARVAATAISDAQGRTTGGIGVVEDITDRKRAEDELRRNRALLEATERLSGVGGWEWDLESAAMSWTQGLYDLHEFDPREFPPGTPKLVERSLACYDAADRDRVLHAFQRCLDEGVPYDLECGFTTARGRQRRVRTMAHAVREDGRIVRVIGNFIDVTRQREAEDRLRHTTALLDAVRQAQALYIRQADTQQVFDLLLQTLVQMSGSEFGFLDEVRREADGPPYKVSLSLSNIAWDADARALYDQLRSRDLVFRDLGNLAGLPVTSGAPVITNEAESDPRSGGLPPGHPAIHSYLGLPIRFAGEVIGVAGIANRPGGYDESMVAFLDPYLNSCAGIIQGLRLRAREETSAAALRASQSDLQSLFDAIQESVFLLRSDGTILAANEVFARRLGRTVAECIGQTVWSLLDPELARRRDAIVQRVLQTGEPATFEDERDGLWLLHSLAPVTGPDGTVDRIAIFAMDLSERRRVEDQLRESEILAALGRTAARVAHEINNPLAGIQNAFRLIRTSIPPGAPYADYLPRVQREIDRIARLIRQMYSLYRPSGSSAVQVRVDESIADVVSMLEPLAREHQVLLVWPPEAQPVEAKLPEGFLAQVLYNLTRNAIEASPTGGEVRINLESSDEELQIRVLDQGPGIAPEAAQRVFQPFYTTKHPTQEAGLGLGLPTALRLVRAMEGSLEHERTAGGWTAFTVRLPRLASGEPLPETSEPGI